MPISRIALAFIIMGVVIFAIVIIFVFNVKFFDFVKQQMVPLFNQALERLGKIQVGPFTIFELPKLGQGTVELPKVGG